MQDTANIWARGYKMTLEEIVGFQLRIHAYTSELPLNELSFKVLTLIGIKGRCELNALVKELCEITNPKGKHIFAQGQGARNHITRLEVLGLVIKEDQRGTNKKLVYLNPAIGVQNTAPVLVDVKAICQ
jgi:hypothetical protein